MEKRKVADDHSVQQLGIKQDDLAIIRLALNSSSTARQIAEKAGITTNVRNVRCLFKNCKHLKR